MEVCAHSKRMPCYCNRQLISILTSVWGIPCETFLEMQARNPTVFAAPHKTLRLHTKHCACRGADCLSLVHSAVGHFVPQREMLRELDEALANTRVARRVLRSYGGLSPVLTEVRRGADRRVPESDWS